MTLRELTPAVAERLGLPRGTEGVVVVEVEAGEAAEDSGLIRGDLIVSVNGCRSRPLDFRTEIEKAKRTASRDCASANSQSTVLANDRYSGSK